MHQTEVLLGIAVKKQTAYATALADSDISKIVLFNSPDITSHEATVIDDVDKLGKGHDWATEQQLESLATKRNFSWDANSLNLPWALGLQLGAVTTTVAEASKAWQHVFKYIDAVSSGRQNPVTSIIEKVGGWETRKIPSLAGNTLKLSGELEKRIKLEFGMIGSGQILTSAITAPSGNPVATCYFINQMCVLSLGNKGGGLTDAGADFHSWEVELNNNLQEALGYYPNSGFNTSGDPTSGAIKGRCEFGKRTCVLRLKIRVKTGSTVHAQLLAGTHLAATIVATGPLVPTAATAKYSFTLDFKDFTYKTMSVETVGDGILVFSLEATPMYDATNVGPLAATVVTDQQSFLA